MFDYEVHYPEPIEKTTTPRLALVAGFMAVTTLVSSCGMTIKADNDHAIREPVTSVIPYSTNSIISPGSENSLNGKSSERSSAKSSQKQKLVSAIGCNLVQGPFTVSGNRILDGEGERFIPYGITLNDLAEAHWQDSNILQEIKALPSWCVNNVRIQASPKNLLNDPTPGLSYNLSYARALKRAVTVAGKEDLAIVLTAQDELTGGPENPTEQTLTYWETINTIFKHSKYDKDIIYNLFNEPREIGATEDDTWQLWHDGGEYKGVNYLGMQTLVTRLRKAGITQEFWVEGPFAADTLRLIPEFPIRGSNIVYGDHHPAPDGPHTPGMWDPLFGDLSKTKPVVDDEFAQYADPGPICWPNAPTFLPQYLGYLKKLGIGLDIWTLKEGVLISGSNLSVPTQMTTATTKSYECKGNVDEGAGHMFDDYFKTNNQS